MLKISVVDLSAESRQRIVDQLTAFLHPDIIEAGFLPRISIKPLSPQELKFQGEPDLLVVGDQLLQSDIVELSRIRRILPHTPILARVTDSWGGISVVEQLARMGADDVLSENCDAQDFLRKVVLLARRASRGGSGHLIVVDSGKGGVGVTSVAAGIAECSWSAGKKTALIDLDDETQDLSRFLQAKPYINEGLKLLFSEERPVTEEFVRQCLVPVWQGEQDFACMPPAAQLEESSIRAGRTLVSLLETLDEIFECIVVDIGCMRGNLRNTLYRAADKIVYVINNDAASLFASVEGIRKLRPHLAAGAELVVVENGSGKAGLPNAILHREFLQASGLDESQWFNQAIAYCKQGTRWPASGGTLFSQSKSALRRSFGELACRLGIVQESPAKSTVAQLTHGLFKKAERHEISAASQLLISDIDAALQESVAIRSTQIPALPQPADAVPKQLNTEDGPVDFGRFVTKATWA